MAFQAGSTIRPELGDADYSGFARAAEIQGAALANFGKEIGQGIEKYKKNKEITGVTLASIEATLGQNPDLIVSGKAEGGSTGKLFSKLEEGGSLNKREALELRGYLDTVVDTRNAAAQREMDLAQLENIRSRTEYNKARASGSASRSFDSYTPKQLTAAQEYMESNNLVAKDGILYRQEKGFFGGGTLVPIDNPSLYTTAVEGVDFLVAQTMPGGAGQRPAASNNNITIEPFNEVASAGSEITQGELASAAPEQLEGSRLSRFADRVGGALSTADQVVDQMGVSMQARPGAIYDYLTSTDNPSYDESLRERERQVRKKRSETPTYSNIGAIIDSKYRF